MLTAYIADKYLIHDEGNRHYKPSRFHTVMIETHGKTDAEVAKEEALLVPSKEEQHIADVRERIATRGVNNIITVISSKCNVI